MTEANVADTLVADVESAESVMDNALDTGAETENEVTKNEKVEKSDETGNNEDKESDFTPFPKKARNAISYRDKKIAKLQAELREYQQKAQQQPSQQKESGPREEDFDNYGDFLEAKILHKISGEKKQPNQAPEINTQQQQYIAQRTQDIAAREAEHVKAIPDFQEVMTEHAELVAFFPPEIKQVLLEADDASLAVYNLAKSGDLASLAELSPYRAAMVVAQAQAIKPQAKPAVAPKHIPMQGAKGTGKGSSSLAELANDPNKLYEWYSK